MVDRGYCSSCQAPIRWVKMRTTGKPMPVDLDPTDDGNVFVYQQDGTADVVKKDDVEAMNRNGVKLHKSHFATCKFAASHRKRPAK